MSADGPDLEFAARELFQRLDQLLAEHHPELATRELGFVSRVSGATAEVSGFTGLMDSELIRFPGDALGIALSLSNERAGVVLLSQGERLHVGDEAWRTRRVVDVPVGKRLLGRVVDAVGRPMDERGPVEFRERWPVERPVPPIIVRAPVKTPLQTGIKAIDAAIPIGRGQRELILGDRQTGKTAIAVDTIINQRDSGVISVYCAIGQRGTAVARVVEDLRRHGVLDRCVVVAAAGEDPPGLQFIAPYAATSIAEYFMDQGEDVLIVYDDLTRHARAYRELSLLLRRPPGREAYPGDVFFIHARMLERATQLREQQGGGSLTALPIIETQAQNISAYIPTNLISITDGQIYLSQELLQKGQLPAIDIGKSVSRVGGKAQLAAFREVAGDLRLSYAQYEELEMFSRFGTRLDEETRRTLARGTRVRELLKQAQFDTFSVPEQIAVLLAVTQGLFDGLALERLAAAERALRELVRERLRAIGTRMLGGAAIDPADQDTLLNAARELIQSQAAG